MKRRFSGSDGSDSLELLLDTLCNVFGGIVLIACLLAIIPRATMPPPLLPTAAASSQMIERRIASARTELQRLEAEIAGLPLSGDPVRAALQSRRESLLRAIETRRTEREEIDGKEMFEANARAIVAQSDPAALNDALERLKQLVVGAENLSKASVEKIRFLEERMKRLGEEAATLAKDKVQAVRFPRERMKKSSPFPIIVRYGKLYPLQIGRLLDNNVAIHRDSLAEGDGFRAEPLRNKGMVMPESRAILMTTLKAAAERDLYVSIYLYPDSYEVFQDLRTALSEAKISHGLDFMDDARGLSFSSEGSSPPEL
jgi:hypothetical protein